MEEQSGPDVYRCSRISWSDEPFDYWLNLTLEGRGGVCAGFDVSGLALLMKHCAPAGVSKPNDQWANFLKCGGRTLVSTTAMVGIWYMPFASTHHTEIGMIHIRSG